MQDNRRFFLNKSLFLKDPHMFLSSAGRVQRMLSIETSFERITRVFKELSWIIPKISCSVGEMHENRSFFLNKSLFLKEPHMFLCSDCRVQQILSIQTCFEGITRVFKQLSWIIAKFRVPLAKCMTIDVSS